MIEKLRFFFYQQVAVDSKFFWQSMFVSSVGILYISNRWPQIETEKSFTDLIMFLLTTHHWLTLHKSKWENKLFCWKVCFLWLKTNWLTNISWPLQFMRQLELLIVDNGIFLFELELKKSVAISLNIWEVSQCFWNIIVVTRYS